MSHNKKEQGNKNNGRVETNGKYVRWDESPIMMNCQLLELELGGDEAKIHWTRYGSPFTIDFLLGIRSAWN